VRRYRFVKVPHTGWTVVCKHMNIRVA
jgi:hypothetical protein